MQFTEENKKVLEHELVETIIKALEEEKISLHDLQPIAETILKFIDQLNSQYDAIEFLEHLAHDWPIFRHVLREEQGVALAN